MTEVEISHQSMVQIKRILKLLKLYPVYTTIRIAVDHLGERVANLENVGYYYDVPIGLSAENNRDCQIYDFSQKPPKPLNESLLSGDCTLAAQVILQYTGWVVDLQESAKRSHRNIEGMSDQELLKFYETASYFNTAVEYAFHELKGPVSIFQPEARGNEESVMGQEWRQKAWPLGLTDGGVILPAGGFIEYTSQRDDTWRSISGEFTGDLERTDRVLRFNPQYSMNKRLESGAKLYLPLEIMDWIAVESAGRDAEDIARDVYGEERFAEIVKRLCRVGGAQVPTKCVVPRFHDVGAVFRAFFGS